MCLIRLSKLVMVCGSISLFRWIGSWSLGCWVAERRIRSFSPLLSKVLRHRCLLKKVLLTPFLLHFIWSLLKLNCQGLHVTCERLQNLVCSVTQLDFSDIVLLSIGGRFLVFGTWLAGDQWLCETRATLSLHYVFAVVFCPAEETFQLSIIVRYFFLAQLLLLDCFLVH